ncbi:conserved hypothetical protein [Ricinus communis]|uniref:Uncharacterized protein n=1 Tax=Ricinus communis TaxID=3988 RepID=B9SDI0_RICCO|nr:conserved hypothetical protein [Ricinus communis]
MGGEGEEKMLVGSKWGFHMKMRWPKTALIFSSIILSTENIICSFVVEKLICESAEDIGDTWKNNLRIEMISFSDGFVNSCFRDIPTLAPTFCY